MSAFGHAGGGDDFEEEEMPYEAPYEAQDAAPAVAPPTVNPPALSSLNPSPQAPSGSSTKALSGVASEFDDEDDFSSPLHAQAVAQYAQAANVALTRPDPLQAQFNTSPPALTISNGRDVLAKVSNPLQASASTGSDPSAQGQSGGLKPPSGAGPAVAGAALPRIHTSPPTYDDSKTSLEALWAQQAATDPSLYTHAVYSRQTHFGKGSHAHLPAPALLAPALPAAAAAAVLTAFRCAAPLLCLCSPPLHPRAVGSAVPRPVLCSWPALRADLLCCAPCRLWTAPRLSSVFASVPSPCAALPSLHPTLLVSVADSRPTAALTLPSPCPLSLPACPLCVQGEVHVIDPEKKGDGITSYITYKVKSSIEHAVGSVTEALVHRRYSDFLWLHEHLFLSQPLAGFLIPPIPNSQTTRRSPPAAARWGMGPVPLLVSMAAPPLTSALLCSAVLCGGCRSRTATPLRMSRRPER